MFTQSYVGVINVHKFLIYSSFVDVSPYSAYTYYKPLVAVIALNIFTDMGQSLTLVMLVVLNLLQLSEFESSGIVIIGHLTIIIIDTFTSCRFSRVS